MNSARRLVAAEPYRLFFPLALLAGIVGVMLWPLFYWQLLDFYPLTAHTRLMVQGFVGGCVIGFLGTAMPKMISAASLKLWQVSTLAIGFIGYCVAHGYGFQSLGDGLFVLTMSFMLVCFGVRLAARKSAAPPQMALAALGIICGISGAAWQAFCVPSEHFYITLFSQKMLYQIFILLPILGVGSFFFPMVLGVKKKEVSNTVVWRLKAAESLIVGVTVALTYWAEVHGETRAMAFTRFAICFIWLAKESAWLKRSSAKGIMKHALRAGIVCLLGGMLAVAVLQRQIIALDHTLYIGGFGLITMIVATRVIYGHSGQGEKFQKWVKPLVVSVGLLLLAMATRVSADFMPALRVSHHIHAAFCWVIVCVIWGIAIMPSVRKRPAPPKPKVAVAPKSVMDMNFRK